MKYEKDENDSACTMTMKQSWMLLEAAGNPKISSEFTYTPNKYKQNALHKKRMI